MVLGPRLGHSGMLAVAIEQQTTLIISFRAPDGAPGSEPQRPIALPPNTDLERFKEFMRRAADIVGAENATVISDVSEFGHMSYIEPSKAHDVMSRLALHFTHYANYETQMFHIAAEDFFISSAVVAPKDVPDVQAMVKLANEFEIPLWPFVSLSLTTITRAKAAFC